MHGDFGGLETVDRHRFLNPEQDVVTRCRADHRPSRDRARDGSLCRFLATRLLRLARKREPSPRGGAEIIKVNVHKLTILLIGDLIVVFLNLLANHHS